ncbi:cobalt-precorrin-6A reductase [Candidatus Gracilibacteria bacterium]|nr:cobalt-precorrin-6A reductase [Candidatus Gracilibacteria bacterium]NJM89308.1 cobalt-precorrin-6A reductase [Hydrococcus sp. RU_2_2]NJP21282.1 cobalt-precorrin-6A reductase [Hydrococcus sp. CRU_1_1]
MNPEKIWLIGGTSESAKIAEALTAEQVPCIVTVTTPAARSLYLPNQYLTIEPALIETSQMAFFCQRKQIAAIVDASHPYATAVSQGAIALHARYAIATATHKQIPYLRYERPLVNSHPLDENAIALDSFETLLEGDYLLGQRVLLTVGYKALPLFQPWQNRATLFARLLPAVNSLEVALRAGFSRDRIIALRPPVSAELEKALWQQWQISLVVTKASGEAGGEDIKRAIALELDIPLIVISRPKIVYPQQTSDIGEVLAFCRQSLSID